MAPVHRRFNDDDEDFEHHTAQPQRELGHSQASDSDVDSESDDDAPEAVSTTAAHDATKEAKRRIAESVKQQVDKERAKRKQRDERLVAQTKSRPKKQGQQDQAELAEEEVEDDDGDDDDEAYPPLLPLDVLAAAERAAKLQQRVDLRAGIPESTRKRKFVDADPKPAKDKRIGHTAVRVLAKIPSGLPPKVSKQSKSVRDSWLSGRRGKNAQIGGRRAQSSSFVTK